MTPSPQELWDQDTNLLTPSTAIALMTYTKYSLQEKYIYTCNIQLRLQQAGTGQAKIFLHNQ